MDSDILIAQQASIVELKVRVKNFVEQYYDSQMQLSLMALGFGAIVGNLPNRAMYIATLSTWVAQISARAVSIGQMILAAQTVDDVNAVAMDFSSLAALNPNVTYAGALAITT